MREPRPNSPSALLAQAVDTTERVLRRRSFRSYLLAALIIASVTLLGAAWVAVAGTRNLGQLYIAAILITAVTLGMRPALLAALLSFLTQNFFLVEPRLSLKFDAPDWLAFATFVVTAGLVGGLAGRLRDRERDATDRLRDLTALSNASRELSGAIDRKLAAACTGRHLENHGFNVAIWTAGLVTLELSFCSETVRAGAARQAGAVKRFFASQQSEELEGAHWLLRLQTGEQNLGVVAIFSEDPHALAQEAHWITALLEQGAVAIDRARLIVEVAQTKLVAEREGLRTALLSSLSHDLRTPISTILASATSLQDHDLHFDEDTKRALLDAIQEEAERLNRYVGNLLDMTRLQSGALQVRRELIDPGEALSSALERVHRRLGARRIERAFETQGARIEVDPVLLEQALLNIIENSLAYAGEHAVIQARSRLEDGEVVLSIQDNGPGIPRKDIAAVFDSFFRAHGDRRGGSGVGLGLSVTRGLVEAFDGQVRAISPAAEGRGVRIEIRLPAQPALEPIE